MGEGHDSEVRPSTEDLRDALDPDRARVLLVSWVEELHHIQPLCQGRLARAVRDAELAEAEAEAPTPARPRPSSPTPAHTRP